MALMVVFLADSLIPYFQGLMPHYAIVIRKGLVILCLVILGAFFIWPLGEKSGDGGEPSDKKEYD
jgi:hypothetical protein